MSCLSRYPTRVVSIHLLRHNPFCVRYTITYTQLSSVKSPTVLLKFDKQKYIENFPIWCFLPFFRRKSPFGIATCLEFCSCHHGQSHIEQCRVSNAQKCTIRGGDVSKIQRLENIGIRTIFVRQLDWWF